LTDLTDLTDFTEPGGVTGSASMMRAIASHCRADVVVCVNFFWGCWGGWGGDCRDVDERSVIVTNSSNAPAELEICACVGMTIAEFFRDTGCDVALLLGPAYSLFEALLPASRRSHSALAALYERAGRVETMGKGKGKGKGKGRENSLTVIHAVPRPVDDMYLRLSGTVWALDGQALDASRSRSIYSPFLPTLPALPEAGR
jgi:hypothetical protein